MDVVILIYCLIKYYDNYSKTSASLWQYYRDELALNNVAIDNVPGNNVSFKFKQKITGQTGNNGGNDAEVMVPQLYI